MREKKKKKANVVKYIHINKKWGLQGMRMRLS